MKRIYRVMDSTDGTHKMVRAANVAQALRHVSSERLAVSVATQDELVAWVQDGGAIPEAGKKEATDGATNREATDDQPA